MGTGRRCFLPVVDVFSPASGWTPSRTGRLETVPVICLSRAVAAKKASMGRGRPGIPHLIALAILAMVLSQILFQDGGVTVPIVGGLLAIGTVALIARLSRRDPPVSGP